MLIKGWEFWELCHAVRTFIKPASILELIIDIFPTLITFAGQVIYFILGNVRWAAPRLEMDQNSRERFKGLIAIETFHSSGLMFLLMLERQVSIKRTILIGHLLPFLSCSCLQSISRTWHTIYVCQCHALEDSQQTHGKGCSLSKSNDISSSESQARQGSQNLATANIVSKCYVSQKLWDAHL